MYMLMLHQLMRAKSLQQLMYDILNQYHKPNLGHGLLLKDPGLSSVLIAPAWLGWGRLVHIYLPCSHISALLFAAESHTQLVKNTTCTSLPCGWLPPTLQNVTYKPVCDIDFTAPKTKRKKCEDVQSSSVPSPSAIIPSPTECEVRAFYEELRKSGNFSLFGSASKLSMLI